MYTVSKEEKNYCTYHAGDTLHLHHVVFVSPAASIDELVEKTREDLDALLAAAQEADSRLLEEMQAKMAEWDAACAKRLIIQEAIRYQTTATPSHSNNEWEMITEPNGGFSEHISNATYTMSIHAHPPVGLRQGSWVVSWYIHCNCPSGAKWRRTWVAGQDNKRCPNREAALRYIQGRKKAYANLFQEEYPPVPANMAELFKVGNKLLPGYVIQSEE